MNTEYYTEAEVREASSSGAFFWSFFGFIFGVSITLGTCIYLGYIQ